MSLVYTLWALAVGLALVAFLGYRLSRYFQRHPHALSGWGESVEWLAGWVAWLCWWAPFPLLLFALGWYWLMLPPWPFVAPGLWFTIAGWAVVVAIGLWRQFCRENAATSLNLLT